MDYQRKRPLTPSAGPHQTVKSGKTPDTIPHTALQRAMQRLTSTPTTAQKQAAQPVLRAANLHHQEEEHLRAQRLPLQRQVTELAATIPAHAIQSALQRQVSERVATVPTRPQTTGDWVTIMRHQAAQVEGTRMDARRTQAFTTLQRQVTSALVRSVKLDPRPAPQRHAEFAQHAVALQRHALTNHLPKVALSQLPPGERGRLQRAVDEAVHADTLQRQQDAQALTLHSLQRQLADLDEDATKPVMARIEARRGSGNPLPAAVQRHLEQGLNHDLSAVRIHDDAEADTLAKGVNAVAFTTGTDIYFRSGTFNPNTQTGLELLAHEVTHTEQQSQGRVGRGIDPDAGLEAEATAMGKKLSRQLPASPAGRLRPLAPQTSRMSGALQRKQAAAMPALLETLTAGQAPPAPFGFVWHSVDGGVNLRDVPLGTVLVKVPNGARLQLLRYDPKQQAYAVRSPSGVQGWVAATHVNVPPPQLAQDPNLRMYIPKSGEGIFKVVAREYGANGFGQDVRYFTNVLRVVNKPSAFLVTQPQYQGFLEGAVEGALTAVTAGRDANGIQLRKDTPFWLPSLAGAKKVQAPSGSFSQGVLDTTSRTFGKTGEQALYGGLFLTGLQVGVLRSLWDALVGLVSLLKLPFTVVRGIYDVIQTVLQGQLLNKVMEIYAFLAGGGLKQVAAMLMADVKAGWDSTNPLKAWEFRGRVLGYVATEILTTFIPIAGVVLKAAKFGKVAALIGSKFKWIAQAGKKAMQVLDKTTIKWPPPGLSPQVAMPGGFSMPVNSSKEVSLGQILRSVGNAVGQAAQNRARVRAPVAGLYKGIDVSQPPPGWKFKDSISFGVREKTIETEVIGPNGESGFFIRRYEPQTEKLIFDEAFLQDLPSWIPSASGDLAQGKGVPTVAYMSMYQMKRMGIGYGTLKSLKMSTIQNFETILYLESMRRKGVPAEKSILQSHSVAYAETTMIQSGHEIVGAVISGGQTEPLARLMTHYERQNPALRQIHDAMLKKYGFDRSVPMLVNFNIELKLKQLPEGRTATPLGEVK